MLKLLFAPIAAIYGAAVHLRNLLFDWGVLKSKTVPVPTICIGNLTVGGTGKTPHVEYLVRMLSVNHTVATLSRGYKRKSKGFVLANHNSTAANIGDEPCQIKTKFPHVAVAVDGNRVQGVRRIIEHQPSTDVVILDDAFQHRYIKAGHSILLVDYNNLITRDYFLPLGKLRDSLSQLRRADTVIITKCPPTLKPIDLRVVTKEMNLFAYQGIYFTSTTYGEILPVFKNSRQTPDLKENTCVIGLAGIANPTHFFQHLSESFKLQHTLQFPDHYNFTEKKIKAIFEKYNQKEKQPLLIVTTEKDAARIRALSNLPDTIKECFYFVPIEVEFLNGATDDFNNKIREYVRKSKRDHRFYTKQS